MMLLGCSSCVAASCFRDRSETGDIITGKDRVLCTVLPILDGNRYPHMTTGARHDSDVAASSPTQCFAPPTLAPPPWRFEGEAHL